MADNAETFVETQADEFVTETEVTDNGAAAVESNLDTETTEVNEETENVDLTENAPAVAANSGDVDKTKEFSRRLNEMSTKKVNDFVSSMGWVNTYTNEPIKTAEEYQSFIEMHNAAQRGVDPVMAAKVNALERNLMGYKLKEQDIALMNDPERGDIYKACREDVLGLVDYGKAQGVNIDVNTAFSTVLSKKLPQIMADVKSAEQKATVKKVAATSKASVGALGEAKETPKMDINSMSDAEFEKLIERVKRGERVTL
jgi:hypothetical protein